MIQQMLAIWSLVPLSFLNHIIISTGLKEKHTFEQDELFCYLITEVKVKVVQSCPTLCDPMDYTVHGILQARILEWIAIPSSRGPSQPRDWTQVSNIAGRSFTSWATKEAGRDWGQEEKGTTEDEMAGWRHWLNGRESQWTPGVGDGQGGLACCNSWGHKELDTTERLNWTELNCPSSQIWNSSLGLIHLAHSSVGWLHAYTISL